MRTVLLSSFLLLIFSFGRAQERIDGNFSFQTDPAKKYSIYVPSSYNADTPNKMMLGLHPFNTNRWGAEAWCDTLSVFAEMNDLLLVCPDGGIDGRIDDPIDTAFTSVLLDSMSIWYSVDPEKVYAMGFSWGGKTVYTYGLNHIDRFAGFMPIGAAVSLGEVSGIAQNATGHPFYLVHGSNDSPNQRFTPLLNAMEDNGACVNSLLMSGVNHTIDFPNRNQILSEAFQWIESVNCGASTSTIEIAKNTGFEIFPNPIRSNQDLQVQLPAEWSGKLQLEILDMNGRRVGMKNILKTANNVETIGVPLDKILPGVYFLSITNGKVSKSTLRIIVQ